MLDFGEERSLRAHIQDILLDYALTHLTTDHVAYTHDATERLLRSALHFIPPNDPTSCALEPPIQRVIASTFNTLQLPPYDEQWPVDRNVIRYMQENMKAGGTRRSERCWHTDLSDGRSFYRPASPILTIKAIKETPKLGSKTAMAHTAHKYHLDEVEEEDIPEQPILNMDEILCNRLVLDEELYRSAITMAKNVCYAGHPHASAENAHVAAFLRGDSPDYKCPELVDLPIFPRKMHDTGVLQLESRAPTAKTVKDLPSLLLQAPVDDKDSEEELYKQHMVVVNGWQAFEFPSSPLNAPTPSLGSSSSQDQRIDELFLLSPPGTTYLQDLLDARMDEVEFPQSEKIGGARFPGTQKLGEGKSLPSFLSTFQLSQAPSYDPRVLTSPKSQPSSPRSTITASMLGQFGDPSELNVSLTNADDYDNLSEGEVKSDDLGGVLRAIFQQRLPKDPQDFILHEQLDERESYIMHVPDLPPPTSKDNMEKIMPTTLISLLSLPGELIQDEELDSCSTSNPYRGFLTPIKGLKSLNMELSWRPFNFGSSIPTHEHLSRVDQNVRLECIEALNVCRDVPGSGDPDMLIETLLEGITKTELMPVPSPSETYWSLDRDLLPEPAFSQVDATQGFILTAAERRRVYGYPDPTDDDAYVDAYFEDENEPPSKRGRHSDDDKAATSNSPDQRPPLRSVRFDDDPYANENHEYSSAFDDSGVYIADPDWVIQDFADDGTEIAFGGLSMAAEGYEGPDDDGDVLPDIDPIHMDIDGCLPSMHDATLCTSPAPPWGHEYRTTVASPVPLPLGASQLRCQGTTPKRHIPDFDAAIDHQPQDFVSNGLLTISAAPQNLSVSEDPPLIRPCATSQGRSPPRSVHTFMKLRSKTIRIAQDLEADIPPETPREETTICNSLSQVPLELVDRYTIKAPDVLTTLDVAHRYMASLDFIQKRRLVKYLSRQSIQLVERECLGGVDLILDQDTAVLLVPLRTLPAQCETLSATLNRLSWHFLHIFIVFETFSSSACFQDQDDDAGPSANPFSPPVIKSVKKLRRDMRIAEGCKDKRSESVVQMSFPLTVDEAAKTIRWFGDMAHDRDMSAGILWDARLWLDIDDENSDEQDLAAIDGMNVFAAAVILSKNNLDDFLDKNSQERIDEFGKLIGMERIATFNRVIARRIEAMQLPSSSPPTTSLGTSNPVTPMDDPYEIVGEPNVLI